MSELAGNGDGELICSQLALGRKLDLEWYDLLVVLPSFWPYDLLPTNGASGQGFAIVLLLLLACDESFHETGMAE